MARKRTATVNFTLRLREDLRRQIETAAKKENRSLNEEMVGRLENSFELAETLNLFAQTRKAFDERDTLVDEKLDRAERMLADAKRMNEEVMGVLDDIEKDMRAGLTVDEIFPRNALVSARRHPRTALQVRAKK